MHKTVSTRLLCGHVGCEARASTTHFRLGLVASRLTLGRIMRPSNHVSRREFIASTSVLLAATAMRKVAKHYAV